MSDVFEAQRLQSFSRRLAAERVPRNSRGEAHGEDFAGKADQIGMVVINGRVAEGKGPLADGDSVDVYELLGGG